MNTKKMKASWFKAIAAAFAAAVMASGAQGAEKITVNKVANHYPWDGKVDCVTTLSGLDTTGDYEYEGVFTLSVKKDGANVRKTVTNAFASADGTYTNTFDCAALFGAGLYPNGGIVVDLMKEKQLGGVQLWKDGPYWAECNVGATKPEEYGYYFWWGDTVGYTRTGNAWISVEDGSKLSGGFKSANCPTYDKDDATLLSEGYIDSTGNLAAAHDAATTHLGEPWRMPNSSEFSALVDYCTWSLITTNGVSGYLVTGKGEYESKSIFLPLPGRAMYTGVTYSTNVYQQYWSSSPMDDGTYAYGLHFYVNSGVIESGTEPRYCGFPVRPVRTVTK